MTWGRSGVRGSRNDMGNKLVDDNCLGEIEAGSPWTIGRK